MDSIRCGFQTIRNLSYKAMEDIIRDRDENGDFKSLAGFIKRIHLKENDITALVSAGVFDEITDNSARSSQLTELLLNKPAKYETKGLFEDSSSTENPLIKEREPLKVILRTQQQTLGFLTDYHPLVLFQKEIKKVKTVKAHQLPELIERTVTLSGWPVAMKYVPTKNRELMSFNTFEDETDLFETVIFPKVFAKYRHLLNMETPLFVTGKVENDHGAIQLNVQSVRRI
jgi:DNA polymerase-3 subunit alpha/error-prone DNA polymerase